MKPFTFLSPTTAEEAISLFGEHSETAKFIAGGTDVIVKVKEGWMEPDYLISLIQQNDTLQLLTCLDTKRRSGIVTFARKDADAPQLYSALMSQGVICASRGGGIRFSPHFYTEKALLDKAVLLASTL